MIAGLRLVVVAGVLVLLARAVPLAWRNRRLSLTVWRGIRPRHVVGSLGLMVAVLATAVSLLWFVPGAGYGLGSLVGLSGNAVFAPLEEVLAHGGSGLPPGEGGLADGAGLARSRGRSGGAPRVAGVAAGAPGTAAPEPWVVVTTVAFLGGLLLLLPWLAYVEERAFREGLEDAGRLRQAWVALKFGLAHLVMLIPLAAALAIAVAGFTYGRVYRRAYRRTEARTTTVTGPLGETLPAQVSAARCRRDAVLESTTWHTAFNSVVVLLVLAGMVGQWAFGW